MMLTIRHHRVHSITHTRPPLAQLLVPTIHGVLLLLRAGMNMQELMKDGRKGVKEIDGTLNRAEKLVEDTLQIGQQAS